MISLESIGTIHTPYLPNLPIPYQPVPHAAGEFWITLKPEFVAGLDKLSSYRYLYILYYLDQASSGFKLQVNPPWAPEMEVGVFASRSPVRPNPIGLSIVELKGIEGNEILISGIDVYNGTPLLDIKPYIKALDVKHDANDGWFNELPDKDHVLAHLLDLPHDHHDPNHNHTPSDSHSHTHSHSQSHNYSHSHSHDHTHAHTHVEHLTFHKSSKIKLRRKV